MPRAPGYINLISKLPQVENSIDGSVTIGDASRKRASVDVNQKIFDNSAVRLNAVMAGLRRPGSRRGQAQELRHRPLDRLRPEHADPLLPVLAASASTNNRPDGGIPTIGWPGYTAVSSATVTPAQAAALMAAPKIDSKNFYGGVHDPEDVKADMVTAKLEMDIGNQMTVRNISRYGRTYMDRMVTGINTIVAVNPTDRSTWTLSRSRQRVNQTNGILANQTSINTTLSTGGIKHDLSTGIEAMYESQDNRAFTPAAATPANLYNPNPNVDLGGSTRNVAGDTSGSTTTTAIYALDTISVTDALKLTAGLRTEHYKVKYASVATGALDTGKWVTSWNVAALYKLAENGTVYAAAANSLTPPGDANSTLAASGQNSTAADAQEAKNYEIGTKWDLLNKRLNLTAALYRSENDGQVSVDSVTNVATQRARPACRGSSWPRSARSPTSGRSPPASRPWMPRR